MAETPKRKSESIITEEYLGLLEKKFAAWQAQVAVARRCMIEMERKSMVVENYKSGELGQKNVERFISKLVVAVFNQDDA